MVDNSKFKVACVQLTTGTDVSESLDLLEKHLLTAKRQGADLVVTPEQTLLMAKDKFSLFQNISYEDKDFGLRKLKEIIKEVGLFVIIGSISIKYSEDLALNRTYVFNPDADIVGIYDKIHMFDVSLNDGEKYHESKLYQPGEKLSVVSLPWCDVGLTICYDLRFPDLYRKLAQKGASIIVVPSAFTVTTGEAHWHTLLRARAIETGCYVLAPAQVGKHENGRVTYGHTMIISPWGEIISEITGEQSIAFADVDISLVENFRKKIPSINQNNYYM